MWPTGTFLFPFLFIVKRIFFLFYATQSSKSCDGGLAGKWGRYSLLPLLRLMCLPSWLDAPLMLEIRSKSLQARRNFNVQPPCLKRMLQSLRYCVRRGRRVPLERKNLFLFLEKRYRERAISSFKTSWDLQSAETCLKRDTDFSEP